MRTTLLAVLLALAAPARATSLPSGEFLDIPVDVRSLGMGEASQGAASGAAEITVNPAALEGIESNDVYFTHAFLYTGVGIDYFAYGTALGAHRFAFSLDHVGYGSLDGRDDAGNSLGTFGPSDTAYGFSYGTKALGADFGATLKYVDSKIVTSAQTLTFDLGLKYKIDDDWTLGASGQNIGGSLKFDNTSFPLPTKASVGAAYRPARGWLIDLDVVDPVYSPAYVAFGTAYAIPIQDVGALAFRAGINSRTPDLGAFAALKFGFGFRFKDALEIDYAFAPAGELGYSHHLGVGYHFNWSRERDR